MKRTDLQRRRDPKVDSRLAQGKRPGRYGAGLAGLVADVPEKGLGR